MDPDLDTYLERIVNDARQPDHIRDLAKGARQQWMLGVIPSEKTLRVLSQALMPVEPCLRIEHDGACGWLRINGRKYELNVPPQGERAMCPYVGAFNSCPGYKKARYK